jgi:hypothetical protein
LDTRLTKEIPPHMTGEHRISITDYGIGKPMETNDVMEESMSDGRRRIRVTQRNEMSILGESVDHSKDDALAMNFGKHLDEIHGNISPNARWHRQWL